MNEQHDQHAVVLATDPTDPFSRVRLSTLKRQRTPWAGVLTSFALIAVLVTAATLGNGLPAFGRGVQADGYKHLATDRPPSAPAANSTGGSLVRLAPASPGAASGSVPAAADELPGLRTRTSRTYLVNGEYQAAFYSGSVNYQDSAGNWQPIDDSLIPSDAPGYAWQNTANQYTLLLPSTLSTAPISFQSLGGSVKLQLAGGGGTASVAGATVTYTNALPGVSVSFTAENDAMKEAVTLTAPQSARALVYSLTLSPGLKATATVSGGVVVTDSSGKEQFGFDAPTMVDALGAEAPASAAALRLSASVSGETVTLALNSSWLGSSLRQFPVTIDPSIHYTADQDCAIENGSGANTNYCGSGSHVTAGYAGAGSSVQRSALQFNVQNAIPAGAQVTHASVDLYLDSASTSSYANVDLFQLTQPWTTAVTWNDYDGSHAWTTAGGTYNSTALAAQRPSTAGWYEWGNSATSLLAQNWLNGTTANDGLLLRAATESNTELYTFESTRQTNLPVLNVFYVDALGQRYGIESHQLTDRSSLAVNVANGNLAVTGTDGEIAGTGLSLSVARTNNSLGDYTTSEDGAFGTWLMGSGADEHLSVVDNHVDFQGPGGWNETFYSNGSGGYTPPPGADASLVANGDGTFTLTYNATAEQLHFSSAGTLTSDVDRNGDTITYASSGGNLSSITDTQGRHVTFTYGSSVGANLITRMTDSTGRTWQYLYASANGYAELTQYTDPAGKLTNYAYGTGGRITKITDALGNQTNLAYDSQFRVTSITYVTNTANQTGPTTTYGYHPSVAGSCAAAPTGDALGGYTLATDANGHATTYCYDLQGLVLQVIDPESATSSATYTTDQHVATNTDALSQTTTRSFNSNNDLTGVTAPVLGSGQNAATAGATYNTPSTVTDYQYLPSSVTDPEGNCTAYVYDAAGNVTDTYAGQASPCDGMTAGTHTATRYQSDPGVSCGAKTGEVCSIINGSGGSTSYGYNSAGDLATVSPPSPAGSESRTVDALSRTLAVTDGKGQKTTYSYDALDRVTQILYNGATTCTPSIGTCISYIFDADGNRQSMTDQSGVTNYYYDALNRITTESLPDAASACSGSSPSGITSSYDGVGNVVTACDSGGTTSYAYDPDNRLLSIAEPGGSCGVTPSLCTAFAYNADGNRTRTTFPGGATQTTGYDNDQNVTSVVGKTSAGTTLTSFSYSYLSGANDRGLVQTTTENDAVASNTVTDSYDAVDRLTGASITSGSGTTYRYGYDGDGNMLTRSVGSTMTTYAYNAADELCWAYTGTSSNPCSTAPTGAATYTFDANGGETGSSSGASFSYNGKNQTTSITYGGTTLSSLAYTDTGQVLRISAGATTFDNEGGGIGIATTGGASAYYVADDRGSVIGERVGSVHYYYLTDRLGSVVAVISGDGLTVSDRYGYDPYGNTVYKTGSVANPFGYAGGYTDATGLIKFGARYYDPTTARWTQIDPVGDASSSMFAYAMDDPVNVTDKTGQAGTCCVGGWSAWWSPYAHFWFHVDRTDLYWLLYWWPAFGVLVAAVVGSALVALGGWWARVAGLVAALVTIAVNYFAKAHLQYAYDHGANGAWIDIYLLFGSFVWATATPTCNGRRGWVNC